jgi:thiamine biosynthesis protein ThiS
VTRPLSAGSSRRIPRVHAVTEDAILADPEFHSRAVKVMRALGEDGALHLRGSATSGRVLCELANALRRDAEGTGALLCINDRLDVALAAGVHGVQLATHSLSVRDARRMLPAGLLGVSVHSTGEARSAGEAGADWVMFGHVHPTPSHAGVPARGLAELQAAAGASGVPCLAVGGVRPEHVPAILKTGAHGFAVIRGIWHADDAGSAAVEYLSAMNSQPQTAYEPVTIEVNGEPRRVSHGSSVEGLLRELSLDPRTVVVEHNRTILRDRSALAGITLSSGDVIEIVHFVGGG